MFSALRNVFSPEKASAEEEIEQKNKKFLGWSVPPGLADVNDQESDEGRIRATLLENTVNDRFAVVLDNVLTAEECAAWLQLPEQKGWEPALLNRGAKQAYRPDVRHSDRCVIDNETLVADLFQRVQPFLPKYIHRPRRLGRKGQIVKTSTFELTGLNERLRFLKYNQGGYFRPHFDGVYCRPDGSEMSWITVMVYFNDDFEGGRTCLLKPGTDAVQHAVNPRPGRAFMFEHDLSHVGEEVKVGTKLCVRTDVMYREVTDEVGAEEGAVDSATGY